MKPVLRITFFALAILSLECRAQGDGRQDQQEFDFYFSATTQKERASVAPTLCMFRGAEYTVMVRRGVSPPPQVSDYQKVGTGTYDDVLCLLPDGSQVDGKQLQLKR